MIRELFAKYKRFIIPAIALVTIATLIIVAISNQSTGNVPIIVFPDNARVSINGKVVGKTAIIDVGQEYHIVAEKEGWKTYDKAFTPQDYDKNIIITLEPNSNEAREWAKKHGYNLSVEAAAGENARAHGDYERKLHPIIDYLTYKTAVYTITYGYKDSSDTNSFYILIKSYYSGGYQGDAIDKIYDMGFDPGDYTIEFENYNNPFEGVLND